MKKILIIVCAAVYACSMTSCSTVRRTASSRNVNAPLAAAVITDLDVSNQKITYKYTPTKAVRRGGVANCINSAISEALAANGNGDVLVETQPALIVRGGIISGKVKSVTVTGYPAKYKNFRSADEATVKAAIINGTLSSQNPSNSGINERKGLNLIFHH